LCHGIGVRALPARCQRTQASQRRWHEIGRLRRRQPVASCCGGLNSAASTGTLKRSHGRNGSSPRVPLGDLPVPRLPLFLRGLLPRIRRRHLGVLLRPRQLSPCLQPLGLRLSLLPIAYGTSDEPSHAISLPVLSPSHRTTPRSSVSDPPNTLRDYPADGKTSCFEFLIQRTFRPRPDSIRPLMASRPSMTLAMPPAVGADAAELEWVMSVGPGGLN